MLSKFPFEIVEEIFLYLRNDDLVEAMKINRYSWKIVHSNKSLLKYRLPKYSPAAVVVQLTDRIGQVQVYHHGQQPYVRKFTIKVRRLKRLNYGKGYEYDSETVTTVNFIIKCCDKHFSGDEYIDSKNVPSPEQLVQMAGQPTKPREYNLVFSKTDPGMSLGLSSKEKNYQPEEAMKCFQSYVNYLTNYYAVTKIFEIVICGEAIHDWHWLAQYLKTNNVVRCKPSISLHNLKVDLRKFYSNEIFQRGIRDVEYFRIQEEYRNKKLFLCHDSIRNANSLDVTFLDDMLPIDDEHLLDLNKRTEISLKCMRGVTKHGINNMIFDMFMRDQGVRLDKAVGRSFKINTEKGLREALENGWKLSGKGVQTRKTDGEGRCPFCSKRANSSDSDTDSDEPGPSYSRKNRLSFPLQLKRVSISDSDDPNDPKPSISHHLRDQMVPFKKPCKEVKTTISNCNCDKLYELDIYMTNPFGQSFHVYCCQTSGNKKRKCSDNYGSELFDLEIQHRPLDNDLPQDS